MTYDQAEFEVRCEWGRQAWHNGGINGFATQLMRFPDEDTVIILLSNFESADTTQMAWALAEILFP